MLHLNFNAASRQWEVRNDDEILCEEPFKELALQRLEKLKELHEGGSYPGPAEQLLYGGDEDDH